jgi:hypothetical protein
LTEVYRRASHQVGAGNTSRTGPLLHRHGRLEFPGDALQEAIPHGFIFDPMKMPLFWRALTGSTVWRSNMRLPMVGGVVKPDAENRVAGDWTRPETGLRLIRNYRKLIASCSL